MNATTVAVDLAKSVFELAAADEHWKVVERARLTRGQFERWFQNRSVRLVVMEACATAHFWARTLRARGIEVRLLPAKYVRAYVKRNKTDAADAQALLEAARGSDITPVAVKSVEQQALQALHRLRSGWMTTRTRRINTLRGDCWDNAVMESFFSTLKRERVYRREYATRDQARADVFDYIERFYNPRRRHSTLDLVSPDQFEKLNQA